MYIRFYVKAVIAGLLSLCEWIIVPRLPLRMCVPSVKQNKNVVTFIAYILCSHGQCMSSGSHM